MTHEVDPRFRHLKKKIAAFVAVALALVVGAVLLIGKENDLFVKKYELSLTVDRGTGFTRGMPVKLSGFRIGRLKSISLNEAAKVDLVLQIDQEYRKWIRSDSRARLVKEGLVGDAVIEISVGSPERAVLQDGNQLVYQKSKALDELAQELGDKVKPMLSDLGQVIGYLNDPQGDVKQAMKNFSKLSRNLELTRQNADALLLQTGERVGAVSGKVSGVLDDTSAVLSDASATVRRASASMAQVEEKLPSLLGHAQSSLDNMAQISRDLKTFQEKELPKVPPLLEKADRTLAETGTVVQAAKSIWPISGRLKAPQETHFVRGDSHD